MAQTSFKRFRDMTLDDYIPRGESQEQAKKFVAEYIADLPEQRRLGVGITFVGPAGVGKTMLASITMNAARDLAPLRGPSYPKFKVESIRLDHYVKLHHRLADLQPLLRFGDDLPERVIEWQEVYDQLQGMHNRDFVLFDDVGAEYQARGGWSNDLWNAILRYRYDYGRPTLITSNTPIEEWADRYSTSMASFLLEATSIVYLVGEDERAREDAKGRFGDGSDQEVPVDLGGSPRPPSVRKLRAAAGAAVPQDEAVGQGGGPVDAA